MSGFSEHMERAETMALAHVREAYRLARQGAGPRQRAWLAILEQDRLRAISAQFRATAELIEPPEEQHSVRVPPLRVVNGGEG